MVCFRILKSTYIPSPGDFVDYILIMVERDSISKINLHFSPQYIQCPDLCRNQFDMIGKTETYNEDANFILDFIGRRVSKKKSYDITAKHN